MIKRSGFSERNPDRTGLSEVEFPPVLILGADFFEVFGVHPENEVVGEYGIIVLEYGSNLPLTHSLHIQFERLFVSIF